MDIFKSKSNNLTRGMNKIVIVTSKTPLQELKQRYNKTEQAKFYIEHLGADFGDYIEEDKNYNTAVERVRSIGEKYGRVQIIDRSQVPNMIFGKEDIVITVGRDGLVANVMKYLDGQPLIGVNPDTKRWDGILLSFEPEDLKAVLDKGIKNGFNAKGITMAKATAKNGQCLYAVNDLFIGAKTHVSARYELNFNHRKENQSSSGIIVSTGLGSTGWYKSVMTQAMGIGAFYGTGNFAYKSLDWGDNSLVYTVREPFPTKFTGTSLIYGIIGTKDTFNVTSKMAENGIVFSDGMEADFLTFNAGEQINVCVAEKIGHLVEK